MQWQEPPDKAGNAGSQVWKCSQAEVCKDAIRTSHAQSTLKHVTKQDHPQRQDRLGVVVFSTPYAKCRLTKQTLETIQKTLIGLTEFLSDNTFQSYNTVSH